MKEKINRNSANLSMAEAAGHHKRLLIHANRRWDLFGIFDKDRDWELMRYEIECTRPTEDELKSMQTLYAKYEVDEWQRVVEHMAKP